MPDSSTLAGLFGSLLKIRRTALSGICSGGAKLTPTRQLDPALIGPRQPFEVTRKSPGLGPLNIRPVTVSGTVPVLVMITNCDSLSVLCGCVEKLNDDGLTCATGTP